MTFAEFLFEFVTGPDEASVTVPATYKPKVGPNKWKNESTVQQIEATIREFDADHDFVISASELHLLLPAAQAHAPTKKQAQGVYLENTFFLAS